MTRLPGYIRRFSRRKSSMVTYATLAVLTVVFLLPIVWMLSTALKSVSGTTSFPPQWIPVPAHWDNFVRALTAVPYLMYLKNSFVYTSLALVGDVLSSSFIAYGFARIRSRYSTPLFVLVLATLMIPYQVLMIPQFILFRDLHWINTYLPLIVPTYFGSPFLIFLMRQFYRSIPAELEEAAKIDGCSHFRIWWQIMLPLSKPALAAVAVFSFMYHWNDYLGPLIYLNSNRLYPASLGLAQYTAAYGGTEWNLLMAASLVTVVPCLVVFFIAQRNFVQGITLSSTTR